MQNEKSVWQKLIAMSMHRIKNVHLRSKMQGQGAQRVRLTNVVVSDAKATSSLVKRKNIRCICYVYVERHAVKILVNLSAHVNET